MTRTECYKTGKFQELKSQLDAKYLEDNKIGIIKPTRFLANVTDRRKPGWQKSHIGFSEVRPIFTIPQTITFSADPVRELQISFMGKGEVRGFQFTQKMRSDSAYLYEVKGSGSTYYEIFERRVNNRFGNVKYPTANAFGKWAWTTGDFNKALKYLEKIIETAKKDLCV